MIYKRYLKRPLDFTVSLMALAVLSPVLLVLMAALAVGNRGAGVFFTQRRPGRGGRLFSIVKFKTMTNRRDASGQLLPDRERITPLGRFMRSTSLDELPQLFNVLKGDMSLIGPRPLLPEYLPLYSPEQARRHDVRPGITGWAQCHGRNAITWARKFELDVWYVDNLTFRTDLSVIATTLRKVVTRADIETAQPSTGWTMPPFDGTN